MSSVLSNITPPDQWIFRRFDRVVRRVRDSGRTDLQFLSVFLDEGVVPRESRDDNFNRLGADTSTYLVVEPGDIVFNKLRTWQGGVGMSKYEGRVSPAYFVCRPSSDVNSRFLHYLLRSSVYLQELTRISKWMPPAQFDIGWEQLRGLPILLPPIEEQRAIADFLEREIARIDTLIEKKRSLVSALHSRFWAALSKRLDGFDRPLIPLRRFLSSISDGPFGSNLKSDHYQTGDDGARVVRLGNIGFAEFRDDDRAFIRHSHFEFLHRYEVREGDLVIAGLGDKNQQLGRACVVPAIGIAIVKADCYRARVNNRALADYLAYYLSSPSGKSRVELASRGTTRSRMNVEIARDILVPQLPVSEQADLVEWANSHRAVIRRTASLLSAQVERLAERREALVVAAVTGQMDINR